MARACNNIGLGTMGIPLCAPYLEIDCGDVATRQESSIAYTPS